MKTGGTNLQQKQYMNTCRAALLTISADSTQHQIGSLNIYVYSEKLKKQEHFTSATKTFMCWFSPCVLREYSNCLNYAILAPKDVSNFRLDPCYI